MEWEHPLSRPLTWRVNVGLQANAILIDHQTPINLRVIGEELDVAGDFQRHVVNEDREEDWHED